MWLFIYVASYDYFGSAFGLVHFYLLLSGGCTEEVV